MIWMLRLRDDGNFQSSSELIILQPKNLPILFWGFLAKIVVEWTPKALI